MDTGIAHPVFHDFYLMSHAGIKGTSRPAHYHVLHDEAAFSADDIQMLTYRVRAVVGASVCGAVRSCRCW